MIDVGMGLVWVWDSLLQVYIVSDETTVETIPTVTTVILRLIS